MEFHGVRSFLASTAMAPALGFCGTIVFEGEGRK